MLLPYSIAISKSHQMNKMVKEIVLMKEGRKEVRKSAKQGIDLCALEGIQVVCSTDGAVVTAYRNRDFRGLRVR